MVRHSNKKRVSVNGGPEWAANKTHVGQSCEVPQADWRPRRSPDPRAHAAAVPLPTGLECPDWLGAAQSTAVPDAQAQARVQVHTPGPPTSPVRAAAGCASRKAFAVRCRDRESQEGPRGSSSFEDSGIPRIPAVACFVVTWQGRRQESPARRREAGGGRAGRAAELQLSEGGSPLPVTTRAAPACSRHSI